MSDLREEIVGLVNARLASTDKLLAKVNEAIMQTLDQLTYLILAHDALMLRSVKNSRDLQAKAAAKSGPTIRSEAETVPTKAKPKSRSKKVAANSK